MPIYSCILIINQCLLNRLFRSNHELNCGKTFFQYVFSVTVIIFTFQIQNYYENLQVLRNFHVLYYCILLIIVLLDAEHKNSFGLLRARYIKINRRVLFINQIISTPGIRNADGSWFVD